MKLTTTVVALGIAATAGLIASDVSAQSYRTQRFDPAPAGDRLFGVQTPSTQGHLEVHGGLVFDYAYNPITLDDRLGTDERFAVVSDQAFLNVTASLALFDRLTVGVVVPTAIAQAGTSYIVGGELLEAPEGPAFGDLRLSVKGSILGGLHDVIQLGVGAYLWAPTGERDSFVGEGLAAGEIDLMVGGEIERFYWNFTTGPQFRESEELVGTTLGTQYGFGGGFGVLLGPRKEAQVGPELRVTIVPEDVSRLNTNGELLLGAKYRFLDDIVFGAAGGPGFTEGYGTPDVRVVFSLMYSPDPDAPKEPAGETEP